MSLPPRRYKPVPRIVHTIDRKEVDGAFRILMPGVFSHIGALYNVKWRNMV